MKFFVIILLCLTLTACSSGSYFNEPNSFFEENYQEGRTTEEIKEYQDAYFNSDKVNEETKKYYEISVLNDYNKSVKDPLFMKYSIYQMYNIGESLSYPNANLVEGSPVDSVGDVFEFVVDDISIYKSIFDVGFTKEDIENNGITQINTDGTAQNGFDLIGINIQIKGNGRMLGSLFDLVYSSDPEKESLTKFAPSFVIGDDSKGGIVVKSGEIKSVYLWFLVDTNQYDYDNLYFCVGSNSLNMTKSFIALGNTLGDGSFSLGLNNDYISKLENYFNSDEANERAKLYYNSIKSDMTTNTDSTITLEKYQYQIINNQNPLTLYYPFEELINADEEYYEDNYIKSTLNFVRIHNSLEEMYNPPNISSGDKYNFYDNVYKNVLEKANGSYNSEYFQKQLTMYNSDGKFLDENGNIDESYKIIFCAFNVTSYKQNDLMINDLENLVLYYFEDEKTEAISLQDHRYSPASPFMEMGLRGGFKDEVPMQGSWIIDTNKYPIDKLYIGVGYEKTMIIRTGKTNYYLAKYIAMFVSGGLTILIALVFNFISLSLFIPILTPNVYDITSTVLTNTHLFSGLYYSQPLIYLFLNFLLNFIFAGLLCSLSFTFSIFNKNRLLATVFPFMFCLGFSYLHKYICTLLPNLKYWFDPMFIVRGSYSSTTVEIVLIEIILLLILSLGVILIRGKKNEIY